MKLRAFIMLVALLFGLSVSAKKYPEIKFEKTTIDFGTFSMDEPIQKAVFRFTNVGKAKLVINYVHASCGCTVAEYPKDYIAPGASGEITVTYNGFGKIPGKVKKNVQIFTNSKSQMTRIFVVGEMTDVPASKKTKSGE
ncbi:MAG: DUF1573 domain-containing protein [Bacteroidaceae bacterium]|nr:DUF1573 domain-containing protein [Bacteroidaceae bacterium]